MLQQIRARTSGFRGVTNTEITPAHALVIGDAFVAQHHFRTHIVTAHDQRCGAAMLTEAVMAGCLGAGADVTMLGCVPTGVFSMVLAQPRGCGHDPYDGGILVTGSHMPPDQIGIIPVNADGTYCTSDITDEIERAFAAFPARVRPKYPWDAVGEVTVVPFEQSMAFYAREMAAAVPPAAIRARNFRVLVDAGNGTAGEVARRLLEEVYHCGVTLLHGEPKQVPDRPSECRASSCGDAIAAVRHGRYDETTGAWLGTFHLGCCFDGDADRVLFLTADGTPLSEDLVGAIFAAATLQRNDVCVTPINSGNLIEVVCGDIGARIEYCKIGQPDTGRAIKQFHAQYAYEAAAKYCFPRHFLWYDAIFAVVKMLERMAQTGNALADLAAEFPVFHRVDRNLALDPSQRERIVECALRYAVEEFHGPRVRIDEMDGTRFTFEDDAWVLLRPSGTEPLARVYADAREQERADALAAAGIACFERAMRA